MVKDGYGKYTTEPQQRIQPKSAFLRKLEKQQRDIKEKDEAWAIKQAETKAAIEREAAEKTVDFKAKKASRQK